MARARRVLSVLIAVALAFAPAGAGMRAAAAGHLEGSHAAHHEHSAMPTAVAEESGPRHCNHKSGALSAGTTKAADPKPAGSKCCDGDKTACGKTCLQKCFSQLALMVPPRPLNGAILNLFVQRPLERPSGWSAAPQPPPPRA